MSTSANSATLFPSWKQEVNRRVAVHLSHKTPSASASKTPQETRPAPASRAAQAAARVAERYARTPSYSESLADEARAAVRAAQAASEAAFEAHATVQYVLAGLEAASSPEPAWEPEAAQKRDPERRSTPSATQAPRNSSASLLFDESPLFSARTDSQWHTEPADATPAQGEDWRQSASSVPAAAGGDHFRVREAAQPIYANLIEFPREMVATRRMRPRRAEGPLSAAEREAQLSIFEVDPRTISTQPAAAVDEPATPEWMRTELSSIELETQMQEDLVEEPAPQGPAPAPVELAPVSRRLLSVVVDATLIVAAVLAVAVLIVANARALPGPRAIELAAALAMLAIGASYHALFLTLAKATPGMKYAGIGLSTIEGDSPSRAQRCKRLMALPLSVFPVGLGLVWALFDDSHLTWHDRLSGTYLRKR